MPENEMAGIVVRIPAANRDAAWLLAKLETSRPKPVLATTYSNVPSASNAGLPQRYAEHETREQPHARKAEHGAATYGSCLPSRNSVTVTGVA